MADTNEVVTNVETIIEEKQSKLRSFGNKAGTWIKGHKAIVIGAATTAAVVALVWIFGPELDLLNDGEGGAPFEADEQ